MKNKKKVSNSNSWIWIVVSILASICIVFLIFKFSSQPPKEANLPIQSPSKEVSIPSQSPKEANPPTQNPPKEIIIPSKEAREKQSSENLPPEELIPPQDRITASDFTLEKIDGGNLSLSDLRGKILLLDFTTTWCYWCDVQAPQVEELYNEYRDKNFTVLSIDCREDLETVRKKYPKGKHIFPVVLDYDGSVALSYGIQGYPTFFLIDKSGKIAYRQVGYKENMKEVFSKIIDYINDNE